MLNWLHDTNFLSFCRHHFNMFFLCDRIADGSLDGKPPHIAISNTTLATLSGITSILKLPFPPNWGSNSLNHSVKQRLRGITLVESTHPCRSMTDGNIFM